MDWHNFDTKAYAPSRQNLSQTFSGGLNMSRCSSIETFDSITDSESGDAAGPHRVPDSIDFGFELASNHVFRFSPICLSSIWTYLAYL